MIIWKWTRHCWRLLVSWLIVLFVSVPTRGRYRAYWENMTGEGLTCVGIKTGDYRQQTLRLVCTVCGEAAFFRDGEFEYID